MTRYSIRTLTILRHLACKTDIQQFYLNKHKYVRFYTPTATYDRSVMFNTRYVFTNLHYLIFEMQFVQTICLKTKTRVLFFPQHEHMRKTLYAFSITEYRSFRTNVQWECFRTECNMSKQRTTISQYNKANYLVSRSNQH